MCWQPPIAVCSTAAPRADGETGGSASLLLAGISVALSIMACCPAGGSSLDAGSPVPPSEANDSDERIVFTSNGDGNAEVYMVAADGTWTVNLTNHPTRDWMPVPSPDGTRIAFESDRSGGQAGSPFASRLPQQGQIGLSGMHTTAVTPSPRLCPLSRGMFA